MGSVPSKPTKSKSKKSKKLMQPSPENGCEPSPEMPRKLFRKQSPEAKKRFQHQMYLARESPEPIFDVSSCELDEIPASVYSLCKVLMKEVLDGHNNDLTTVSEEIGDISTLQVLNLENNKIKTLPESLWKLQSLQHLNIKGNKLKSLPSSIRNLKNLQKLDISMNNISVLPKELCQLNSLDELILDANNMNYPPADVCMQGTESIMKFICQDCDVEYHPPTITVKTRAFDQTSQTTFNTRSLKADVTAISETLSQYQIVKEKKKQEQVYLEKQLEEEQKAQAELVSNASRHRQLMLQKIAQQQDEVHNEIMSAQNTKDIERKKLLETLEDEEKIASRLVEEILKVNENARKTEALLEAMEQERIEAEQLFIVRKEEFDLLREKEVLAAMEYILQESEMFDELIRKHVSKREATARKSIKGQDETDGRISDLQQIKEAEKTLMAERLLRKENLQKEAFEALLQQRDIKHQRLTGQIEVIQDELTSLSVLEMEQRDMRMDTQRNILVEKRQALASLLLQLMQEKQYREEELKNRLMEMENQRLDDQVDYWLVQYQRLMDRKPQALINQEYQLEQVVIDILERAAATEYIPQFARRKISIETLCQMTIDDLKLMGIREPIRSRILAEIDFYKKSRRRQEKDNDTEKLTPKEPWKEFKKGKLPVREDAAAEEPTAPPDDIIGRVASECVICMNDECSIIFLTCGHVCCCVPCGEHLDRCPLCRANIKQRIKLTRD